MRKKDIIAMLLLYTIGVAICIDNHNNQSQIILSTKTNKQRYKTIYERVNEMVDECEENKREEYVKQKVEELRAEKERIRLEEERKRQEEEERQRQEELRRQQEEQANQVVNRGGDVPSGREIDVEVSWYCGCNSCTPGSGITASGKPCTENLTIAMPPEFPFGTKILIDGIVYECMDTGSYIKTVNIEGVEIVRVDIYTSSHQTALQKGRYRRKAIILN